MLRHHVGNLLMQAYLRYVWLTAGRKLLNAARDPMRVQQKLLRTILNENEQTIFGKKYSFDKIEGYDTFSKTVPNSDYESLRDYIDAEIQNGEKSLTNQSPFIYMRTSGTSGQPKDIPLTHDHLEALKRIHQVAVANQYRLFPEAFSGSILAITSPAKEGILSNGKPYGSASGIVSESTPSLVRDKFVLPHSVLTIANSKVKYLLILRLALTRPDITYISCANPTTLLTLIKLYREHQNELIESTRNGGFFLSSQVPQDVWTDVSSQLISMPAHAERLVQLQANSSEIRLADLWPRLHLIITWTCASAGVAVSSLRSELSPKTQIMELGYMSSEFRGTITLEHSADSGLPTFDTHFFEFVERDKWDTGEPIFLTLDTLKKGVDYYVIVTTQSGLYRYFINDLVQVTGFFHQTPLLRFLQKGKGVTNITGEKLYESQALAAIQSVMHKLECSTRFIMILADDEAYCYRFYVESDSESKPVNMQLADMIDHNLKELNIEYASKRESSRLSTPCFKWLAKGTLETYKKKCIEQGQREGQFKTVALAYAKNFEFDLDAYAE